MREPSVSCPNLRDVSLWGARRGAHTRGVLAAPVQGWPHRSFLQRLSRGSEAELRDAPASGAGAAGQRTDLLFFLLV